MDRTRPPQGLDKISASVNWKHVQKRTGKPKAECRKMLASVYPSVHSSMLEAGLNVLEAELQDLKSNPSKTAK